jgi:excisionase family DNA binding protein
MTLEEVADLLGVNYQLIYKLVRSGEMASLRIGRVYRVTQADFEAYIQKSRSHQGGGVCAVCGTAYDSRLSLKHACLECGGPICVDCWSRKKVRVCPQHDKKGGDPIQPAAEPVADQLEDDQEENKQS